MQVLVTGPGEHRTRWVQRAQQGGGFLVNVAIQLLGVTLTQPLERVAPGWIGMHGVRDHGWVVVPEMRQLLGLAEDGVAEERERASVRPMHI